jgi:two-component system NarL family sensor kinase
VYHWVKPSTQVESPKLGYVTVLERWGWMIGTGIYLDDIDVAMRELDGELERNVHDTLLWIAGAGAMGMALLFAGALLLSFTEQKASDAKLALLARKVVSSQEEERAHLSRELHDGTGQTLVVIKLLIESALDRMLTSREEVRGPLKRALERVKDALVDVRGMSHRLRPVMLDTLGLPAALEHLGRETCEPSGIHFLMEVEGPPRDLPDDVKTVLFRITQEAMNNIQKHAASSHVEIHLVFDPRTLQLSVQDDGCGFNVETVREHPRRGIGLRNMRERIETIGGELVVQSQPGRTRITALLPNAAIRRLNTPR